MYHLLLLHTPFILTMGIGTFVTIVAMIFCSKRNTSEIWEPLNTVVDQMVLDGNHYSLPIFTSREDKPLLKAPIKTSLELPLIDVPQDITDPKDIAHYAWKQINDFAKQGNKAAIAILEKPETRLSLSFRNKKED